MYRLRLLLVLACLVVLGASLASGQDGTPVNNQDKKSDHNSKQEKAKSNDNHRKHWWSPPHLFHKKHDKAASASQTGQSPFSKTNAAKTSSTNKAVTGARPTSKTVAATGTAGKGTTGKKTTATGAGKKRHDCTPEETKKGGCVVDKGRNQKATAKPS